MQHGSAKIIDYEEYDRNRDLICPICGWEGTPKNGGRVEWHRDLMDVSCPRCDRMLLIVNYPLVDSKLSFDPVSRSMEKLAFSEIEDRVVAKGVSGGRGFAFVFNGDWRSAPGLVRKSGAKLSHVDFMKDFPEAARSIDRLYALAKDVPESAFA